MKTRQLMFAFLAIMFCFVSSAFAQNVAKVGDTEYATLSAAITAAESGNTVTFIGDVNESVTVSKSITIDGAGKTYTGTMTAASGFTVTVKNVNFYNGFFTKTAKSSKGIYTIKNCTFDGAGKQQQYAVKIAGASKFVVEDCSVEDYEFGFFYTSSSLVTHSVKNVTVENCNYGVRMGSTNTTNLVNFVTKDVKYPVQIQANAGRTVNMTDCSITEVKDGGASLSCWGGTSKVTFNFKGTNTFDAALPEEANFDYVEDEYDGIENVVIVTPAVAKIGETGYETLSAAVAAANAGDVITFVADITDNVGEGDGITKAITIDGAGHTFTGEMNFKAKVTIKNVNFDGKGFNGYAVEARGSNSSVTIENCTVKDYGYGFLQMVRGTTLTVKNLTVSDVKYGLKIDRSSKVSLENVNIDASACAVYNSNYAAKTITIKNCKLNNVVTWNRKTGYKTSYVFEGENTVGEFETDDAIDNFKLVAEAELTAPEGKTVATDAGYKVVYVNGKYVSVKASVVAMIGEQGYDSFSAALENVKAGETIVLCADVEVSSSVVIDKNITLDGAGNTLTYTGSDRAITVESSANGANLTVKNLTVDCTASYCQRGINYNTTGALVLEGVTVKGTNVTYAVNLPGSSDGAQVTINDSNLSGNIALNVWGENSTINATNTIFTAVDNNTVEGYAAVKLNNDGETAAEGTVINITGGEINVTGTAADDSEAVSNGTATGEVNISDTTNVNGKIGEVVAVIRYANGTSYSFTTIEEAIAYAKEGETVVLIRDIKASAIVTIDKAITLDGNGKTLTSTAGRAINVDVAGNVVIKNLTINASGERAINVINKPANVTIDNVTATAANYTVNLAASAANAVVAIKNSNLTGLNVVNVTAADSKVTVEGGKLVCNDQAEGEYYSALMLNASAARATIEATGVTFDIKGNSRKAHNATADGTITIDGKTDEVEVAVATIVYGDNAYTFTTIEAAIAKANEGETVTLLRDVKASAIVTIDKAITLDGNGKTLTSTAGRAINVSGADGVTIKNLTINATGERAINVIQNATNVTIEKVTATAANYTVNVASSAPNAMVAINNSILNGLCTVNVSAAGANVTVENSTVNCNDNNTAAGEAYAALSLNKEAVGGSIVATNTTVNVAEGSDSMKGRNSAENGTVTINGSTDGVAVTVAVITYEGSDYYYSFASLAKAVEFAKAGETVTMLRSATGAGIVINKSITIDFNGKTYSFNEAVGSTGTASNGLQILKGNTVTLKNGKLEVAEAAKGEFYILVQNYANLTVKDMTLDGTNLDKWSATDGDSYVLSNNCGTVAVEGSTITANNDGELAFAMDACLNAAYEAPVVTVAEGSTINGNVEVSATLNMNGTLGGEVVINGTTGVVNAANELTVKTTVEKHKVVCAEADGKYSYSVKELNYVAQIGETKYEDLAEAFAAAQNDETVTLIADITFTNENAKAIPGVDGAETMVTVTGKNVTLDMNGKTIAVENYTNDNGTNYSYLMGVFYVVDGAGLTVTGNGTIDIDQDDREIAYIFWKRGTTGHLVIKNGNFNAVDLEDSMIYTNGSDIVTVEGGTFILEKIGGHNNGFPCIFNAAGNNQRHINVTGGTYNTDVTKQKWANEVQVPDTHSIVDNGDGTWTVMKVGAYVAESAEGAKVSYSSLAAAVAAAQDGNIVTLAADAEGEGVVINKSITIDFDGYTYTFNNCVGSTNTKTIGFQILKGNTVVLKNGTLNSTAAVEGSKEVKMLIQNYADLTLVDMNLVDETEHILYALSNNCGTIVLEGETNITTDAVAFDSYKDKNYAAPTVKVYTTGTITGNIEKNDGATIELYSGTYSYDVTEYCAPRHAVVDNHDGTYTVEALDVDRLVINHIDYYTYENQNEKSVKELVYNRDIYQEELGWWTTLFVPFEVPVKALLEKGIDVAYINNVRSYDKNDDAIVDSMYVEYMYIKSENARLHANTPYMIRADKQEELSLSLVLENATLCKTDESERNNIYMASAFVDFTLAGVYENPTGADIKAKHNADVVYQSWIEWANNNGNYAGMQFYPFEAYLTIKAKPGSPFSIDTEALKSIGGRVVGEEYDGTTYIYDVVIENGEEVTYDLQGRRVDNTNNGIYIKGGNKVLVR